LNIVIVLKLFNKEKLMKCCCVNFNVIALYDCKLFVTSTQQSKLSKIVKFAIELSKISISVEIVLICDNFLERVFKTIANDGKT
jgi:uncharacterized protein YlaN (UPF0358 family)